ncbi:callose synthase 7-like isoform X5 [Zingiber officinale]|uniref:callose synthase 7-like isoform X5 n=1 Tax=Zingiber officinale TaxID=94328 RepID=UPI001C4D71D6|nr:callose synthase 7-like isoform X5 [Zingiber officinale]
MEIDLTHGSQLVYVIPDTMLTISDFYRNIQVSILARGYENWRNGEANLLITRGLVGRLSNTPNVGFAYEIQNVVDYLASHGVRTLPGRSYNTRDVLGHNWVIRQSTVNIPMQPTEVNTRNMLDGSVSLQFDQYQAATSSSLPKFNSKDEEIQSDEEELTSHTIGVLVEERGPELLVKRLSSLAQLPVKRTSGAAGYDISITHAQDIPALGRSLLQTGICIQIPQNTYARIAPRSSTALRGIIIMGGVIDSDYRGEVKIATPIVREVELLGSTERGASGFGSTTNPAPQELQLCSSNKANPLCQGCYYCCSDEDCAAEYDNYVAPDPQYQLLKGKAIIQEEAPIKRVSGYQPLSEEQLLALQKQARQYAIEQHKYYEEEAYQNLIDAPPSIERSLAITRKCIRTSREYRRELQAELDAIQNSSQQSSNSGQFLCMFTEQHDQNITGRRRLKTNFVEVRTFWHLFRSFERMWTFFILAFQAMLIIAWSPSGSLTAFFDPDVFRRVLSIFITAAFLNFFQATLDIILSWKAWGSKQYTQILRYLLKFAVATAWIIILSASYSGSIENPTGLIKLFSNWAGNWRNQSLYTYAIIIYMLPNIFSALLFLLPPLRRSVELSNSRVFILLMWWAQPKLYVGRGMHEDMLSLLKYTLFWILLLISKLAFSYYVEIYPLVEPTKMIMAIGAPNYAWHEFFPYLQHNIGVVITIWAPIVLVYFMDTQIWYAIFSTIFGGIHGAFSHLGEIRTLGMLRSRFETVPSVFTENLMPTPNEKNSKDQMERMNIAKFSHIWNEFISSLREEDLISNRERDLLLVPYSFGDISVVQWPPFLLASKIPIALDMAKDFKKKDDKELINKIKHDKHMTSAVIECYETLRDILKELLIDEHEKRSIDNICKAVESSITTEHNFLVKFRMSELPLLSAKLAKLLNLLKGDNEDVESYESQIVTVLQDIMEIITQDVMTSGHGTSSVEDRPKFSNLNLNIMEDASWKEKVDRLHLLLTIKESAIDVPINLDARRRITFFANSLFMDLPPTPKVRNMLSFSVLTPYYKEDVLYSEEELKKENEDGISTLFYLQKIYPDEWKNFLERVKFDNSENMDELRHWVSYRGQTLARTVRGMMYYRRALRLQCFLDTAKDPDILGGFRTYSPDENNQDHILARALAIADMKFTYVVSCQVYGIQKKSTEARDRSCYTNILNLMLNHHSLRVAYIDEAEETVDNKTQKCYYSVLVKGGDKFDEEIYRIKLPGKPTDIGEGKPENQNHAIIFTRGEALQTIDMNQDNYLEEAFKIRNVLGEFLRPKYQKHPPTILGLREHIFTGSVSSLAWFMSNQETSFVTIGQRILANPLKVRFHYGHPDIFDRIFHLTRGGISKASRIINLSEDIFSGFNSTLRGGNVTHHEYMQVGKGRDVGLNQISIFEAKVSKGNGEQTLSRDVYRLGRRFDFYRMLSFYFTTVGFYFSSMITVLTVYVFLYGRLYLVMSGLERSILEDPRIQQNNKPLENALASQSVFQLGLLLVLPMVMEVGLEKGFRTAIGEFIIMQLQLASVFFTFQLGTKAHYFGRTILHGGAKYSATGRGFVVFHAKFADNYRMYSRSHFVKGLELMILLVVYEVYGHSYRSSSLYLFVTMSMWFLVVSWLFAPFIFNPSGFEWQKTVDDWTDWKKWMGNRGGIGIAVDRSWESWWETEHEHLKSTSIRGRMLEIILALRFLIFQYGIVYHLNIAHNSRSVLVYGLSWLVMLTVLLVLKMVSMGRRGFGTDFQLMFRILKGLLFLGFVSVMTVLFVVCNLTLSDVFAALLGFMPTGWSILLIGQACRPLVRRLGFWDSIKELGRAYEYIMGMVIFVPIVVLSWFPFVSEFQTRLLFNQAFSRGLQISMILAGRKDSNMYGS